MSFSAASTSQRLIASPSRPVCKRPTVRPQNQALPNSLPQKTAGAVLGGLLSLSVATVFPEAFTPPAQAGVILKQPERKSVFYGEKQAKEKAAAAAPSPGGGGSLSLPNFGDAGVLALPVSLAGIAGATVVGRKVDNGLDGFLRSTLIKDNNEEGAGYEVAIKEAGTSKKK